MNTIKLIKNTVTHLKHHLLLADLKLQYLSNGSISNNSLTFISKYSSSQRGIKNYDKSTAVSKLVNE